MRLEVTRRAEPAVRALSGIDHDRGRVTGREPAEMPGTAPSFVAQVAVPLVRAGRLRSDRGPAGGDALAVGEESVLDVIEACGGPADTGRCVATDRPSDADDPCVVRSAWIRACGRLRPASAAAPLPRRVPGAT